MSIPQKLIWITGIHMGMGWLFWSIWLVTGNEAWIRYFFDYQGALFFVGLASAEVFMCVLARRQFAKGEPLRYAWSSIILAASFRFSGMILSQILGSKSLLNPLVLMGSFDSRMTEILRETGQMISGPAHMVTLAIGLFVVVQSYNRNRLICRLNVLDYFLLSIVGVYALQQVREMFLWSCDPAAVFSFDTILHWATDPLLCVLLFEAILIRRATSNLGWGLISKCWAAYVAAIFITSIGDMGIWATNYGHLPWPASSVVWYLWFPSACAYALGPAYQVEAALKARTPLH
jgi:hypothetical protein